DAEGVFAAILSAVDVPAVAREQLGLGLISQARGQERRTLRRRASDAPAAGVGNPLVLLDLDRARDRGGIRIGRRLLHDELPRSRRELDATEQARRGYAEGP